MSKQAKLCIFGCHRNATRTSDICSTCKGGLRYWDTKDHADILIREEHLKVLAARMHYKAGAVTRKRIARSVRARVSARHEVRV